MLLNSLGKASAFRHNPAWTKMVSSMLEFLHCEVHNLWGVVARSAVAVSDPLRSYFLLISN